MSGVDRDETTSRRRNAAVLVVMGLVGAGAVLAVGVGDRDPFESHRDGDELTIEPDADPAEEADHPIDEITTDPAAGSWRSLPEAPITGREDHTVTWTGEDLIVWGGRDADGWRADGAAFDPDTDEWRPLPDAPMQDTPDTLTVWTGEQLVVLLAAGSHAAYDPDTDQWRTLPEPPERHWQALAGLDGQAVLFGDRSAATITAAGEWEALEPPPLTEVRAAVATGGRLVVLGARHGTTATAVYDPVDDHWARPEAAEIAGAGDPAASGDREGYRMLVVRRAHGRETTQVALEWNFDGVWRRLPRVASPLSRASPELIAAAGGTVAWAPYEPAASTFLPEGADTWAPLGDPPDHVTEGARAVWTGEELLAWGGAVAGGGAWRPASEIRLPPADTPRLAGEWRTLPEPPVTVREPSLTWTGTHLLVWGGKEADGEAAAEGARYDVGGDGWEALPPAPIVGRTQHAAAWTREELVIWGGRGAAGWMGDGAAYDPAQDAWRRLPASPLPADGPAVAEWHGSTVVVAAGSPPQVAAYDPRADEWRSLPAPPAEAGRSLGLAAGAEGLWLVTEHGSWLLRDPGDDTWESQGAHVLEGPAVLGTSPGDVVAIGSGGLARYDGPAGWWRGAAAPWEDIDAQPAAWTGRHLYVWGAARVGDTRLGRRTAAAYDPASDVWNALPDPPPTVDVSGPAAWTGEEVVWWQPHGGPVAFMPAEP